MPAVFPNTFVAGATMTWADIEGNFDAFRTWNDSIPLADISAGGIERTALVAPISQDFPAVSHRSLFGSSYNQNYGLDGNDPVDENSWGPRPTRLTVIPESNDGIDEVWRYPIGRRLILESRQRVSILCSFDANCRSDTTTGATYPDLASGGDEAGYWEFRWRNVETGQESRITASRRDAYPMHRAGAVSWNDPVNLYGRLGEVAAGKWDVYLCYVNEGGTPDIDQIDITRVMFHAEAI